MSGHQGLLIKSAIRYHKLFKTVVEHLIFSGICEERAQVLKDIATLDI